MRNIIKNHEPSSLTRHRCQSDANYENYLEKQDLRDYIAAEQGYICAYCMQRIRADEKGMKIEHWHCQNRYPTEDLDYGNLLGVCFGGEGQQRPNQHCDTRKGNADLCKNPAFPTHNVEATIHYLGDGYIKAEDATFNRELNRVLNLNHPQIVNNRKKALDGFIQWLRKILGTKNLSRAFIERKIRDLSDPSGGEMVPFCMIVVYWLHKRLARI